MSFRHSNKSDFDDMNVYHQTKSQFKNLKENFKNIQNSRRSPFVDCFTGDSVISPATICPPGVNSTKNFPCVTKSDKDSGHVSHFSSFNCPPGTNYNAAHQKCESFTGNAGRLNANKREMISNRKRSFFYSIVE